MFTDDYPSNTVRGQSRLFKAFWLTDDEWKDDLRKKRDAKHRDKFQTCLDLNEISVWVFVFLEPQ